MLNTEAHDGGQIVVYPGFDNPSTLNQGSELNSGNTTVAYSSSNPLFPYSFKTDFLPGIACAPDQTEYDYNCLLAWNDRLRMNGQILYTYFRINGSGEIEWVGRAWARGSSYNASNVSAGYFAGAFWMGWKQWTNPQKVAWTMNQVGGNSTWTTVETLTRANILDPPSFGYVADDPSLGAIMSWTEAH